MRHSTAHRNGFTLVEALAAFAILALVTSGLLKGVSGAARNEGRANSLLRAARLGHSQLAQLGETIPIVVGQTTGLYEEGLRWTMSIAPAQSTRGISRSYQTPAYWAYLTIGQAGTGAEILTLATLKLVPIEENQK